MFVRGMMVQISVVFRMLCCLSSWTKAMSVLSVTHKIIQRLEGLGHSTDDVSWSASSSEPEESEHGGDINWEIPRKVLHSSIGPSLLCILLRCLYITSLGFFTLYFYVSESPARYVIRGLWSSLCIIYPADLLRFRYPSFARLYERLLGFLMRNSEKVTNLSLLLSLV